MTSVQTPVRQPFGVLGENKLRNLQSIKNRQNSIISSPALSLKRRATSPGLSDSENVDPVIFDKGSSKRRRTDFEDDFAAVKQPRVYVKPALSSSKSSTPVQAVATPQVVAVSKLPSTPISAPSAAGRSPTHSSTHSRSFAKPRGRFLPPSFHTKSHSLSITAALKGTLAHVKRPTLKRSRSTTDKEARCDFTIFEESEELQDYRVSEWTMTQSSASLGISDEDLNAAPEQKQDKGKENIDPNEIFDLFAPSTRMRNAPVVGDQATMDTSKPRTPLGDLEAAKFYGDGLDATSVVLVNDDDAETVVDEKEISQNAFVVHEEDGRVSDFTFEAPFDCPPTQPLDQEEFTSSSIPAWTVRPELHAELEKSAPSVDNPADVEIWESESAKDENENVVRQEPNYSLYLQPQRIVVGDGESICVSV